MRTKNTVSEINIPEYLMKFAKLRTSLSDFYVKTKNCRIIGTSDEEHNSKGFLLAEPGATTEILFITAENDNPAVKKALLNYLMRSLPRGSCICWRIIDNAENERLAIEYGFRPEKTLNIYRTIRTDDEKAEDILREYEKMYAFMEKRGYRTVNFNELSEAELFQIRNNPDGEFDSALRPEALIADRIGGFSEKMSFASIRDGKVAAYTVVRTPDGKNCIFEIICVAKSERRNGIFILPFYRSFQEIKVSGAETALFAVYDNNSEMLKLVRKRFSQLIASQSIQHNLLFFTP